MNIKKIIAIMAVKNHLKEDVGKTHLEYDSNGNFSVSATPKKEAEVITEFDFKEPQRKNFEDMVNEILLGHYEHEKGLSYHFLTEYELKEKR